MRDGALTIAAATLAALAIDHMFRQSLSRDYVAFYTSPLLPRTPLTCLVALGEEAKFRLVLMTALFFAVAKSCGHVSSGWACAVIAASQLANVSVLLVADPLYGSLRWWLIGCLWGWLYWRHGWTTAATAHGLTHCVLDPLLLHTLQP